MKKTIKMDSRKELTLKYDESVLKKLKTERTELRLRIRDLKIFLKKYKPADDRYTKEQFQYLLSQINFMEHYDSVLSCRIGMMLKKEMEKENGKDN